MAVDLLLKRAYVGMQCFWGESKFGKIKGVRQTKVGYAGGTSLNPTYTNLKNYTEVIELHYDEKLCSYSELIEFFFSQHDPTVERKRQYQSAIYYVEEEQRIIAERLIAKEQTKREHPILTCLQKLEIFYPAENYHQKYWLRCQRDLFIQLNLSDEEIANGVLATKINAYVAGSQVEFQELELLAKEYNLSKLTVQTIKDIVMNGAKSRACH